MMCAPRAPRVPREKKGSGAGSGRLTVAGVNVAAVALALASPCCVHVGAMKPSWGWDTVGHMAFTHTCNASGPWSGEALDVLAKFPLVTVERFMGQDTNGHSRPEEGPKGLTPDMTGLYVEDHTTAALRQIKERSDGKTATIFYHGPQQSLPWPWCARRAGGRLCVLLFIENTAIRDGCTKSWEFCHGRLADSLEVHCSACRFCGFCRAALLALAPGRRVHLCAGPLLVGVLTGSRW